MSNTGIEVFRDKGREFLRLLGEEGFASFWLFQTMSFKSALTIPKASAELEHLFRELKAMAEELIQSDRLYAPEGYVITDLSDLARVVSHELHG